MADVPEVVLVCGSREWVDPDPIRQLLGTLPPKSLVVHGDQYGADRLSGYLARDAGIHVAAVPALWQRYGKGAGPMRNAAMALLAPAVSRTVAFPLPSSKGTWGMLGLMEAAGVRGWVWDRGRREFIEQ